MDFTFDVVGNTDIFVREASINGPRFKTSSLSTTPVLEGEDPVAENVDDTEAAFAYLFPAISIPGIVGGEPTTRLHVLRGLGEGIMGRVFLARDSGTSRVFALKVFDKRNVLESDEIENTVMERSFLAETCDNSFIVDMHASFQDENRLYMLLEFCARGDLAVEILRWQGKMPMSTVTYNVAHLLEGIAYLHTLGIVHRDLKPENILLTLDGHIKISDFGSAARIIPPEKLIETSVAEQFGTVAYLAPEVIAGSPHDFAIDWWCLGIIVYEMVMGEHPFLPQSILDENVDIEDLQESICNGEYILPKELDPSSRHIIRGFLRTNPDRRYDAVQGRKSKFFEGWDWRLVRDLKYQPPQPHIVYAQGVGPNLNPEFVSMGLGDEDARESRDSVGQSHLFTGFEPVPTL